MRHLAKLIGASMLLVFSTAGLSAEPDKPGLAAALMQQSGMNIQIDLIPGQVELGIRDSARQGAPMDVVIQDKLVSALDTRQLNQNVKDHLIEQMSIAEMEQVMRWFESPLGAQVVAMEVSAAQPGMMGKMFQSYEKEQARPGRLARIQRLGEAVLSKARTKDLMINMQVFFGMAMMAERGAAQQVNYRQTRSDIEAAMAPMWGELDLVVTMVYLYTYQSLSDAELDRYIEFTESAAGRKFNQVVFQGLSDAFVKAGQSLRQSLKSACRARQPGCDGTHPYPLV